MFDDTVSETILGYFTLGNTEIYNFCSRENKTKLACRFRDCSINFLSTLFIDQKKKIFFFHFQTKICNGTLISILEG